MNRAKVDREAAMADKRSAQALRRQLALLMFEQEIPKGEIARSVGLSWSYIRSIARAAGLARPEMPEEFGAAKARRHHALQLISEGVDIIDVARRTGYSERGLAALGARHGVIDLPSFVDGRQTPEARRAMLRMYRDGAPMRSILEVSGYSIHAVYLIASKAGIKRGRKTAQEAKAEALRQLGAK